MELSERIQISCSKRAKNCLGHRNAAQRRYRAFCRVGPPKSCQGEDYTPRVDRLSYFRPSRVCLESKSIRRCLPRVFTASHVGTLTRKRCTTRYPYQGCSCERAILSLPGWSCSSLFSSPVMSCSLLYHKNASWRALRSK